MLSGNSQRNPGRELFEVRKVQRFLYITFISIVFDDIKCGTNYCCVGNSKPVVHTLSDRGTNSLICSSHE